MPTVEVYGTDGDKLLFTGEFAFLPRAGDTISKDMGGYFEYHDVTEVWHREEVATGVFQACVRVDTVD